MNSKPTHGQISRRAQELWENGGRPSGRDEEIWLEAERQLATGEETSAAFIARIKAETAAESAVEYLISPPIPQEEAVKKAVQMPRAVGGTSAGKAKR
jgi:hypothetical protein